MVSFIILHYKNIDETLKCLECLQRSFSNKDISLIVVDNSSLSKNEKKQIEYYTKDVIELEENLGFAKANNIGCRYAIKKYHPDFLAVINNDVYIEQKEFIDIIEKDFKKYNFDLLGPWIDSTTGESCNPFPVLDTTEKVIKVINKNKKLVSIYNNSFLYFFLNVYIKIKHFIKKPNIPTNSNEFKENVALHGCAIIFSKKYYEKYEDIFYNETFLFHEEEFLYNRIINDDLKSIYDPKLKVFHKEGASIKTKGNKRISKLFKTKEKIKSLKLLLEVMYEKK